MTITADSHPVLPNRTDPITTLLPMSNSNKGHYPSPPWILLTLMFSHSERDPGPRDIHVRADRVDAVGDGPPAGRYRTVFLSGSDEPLDVLEQKREILDAIDASLAKEQGQRDDWFNAQQGMKWADKA